jgi:hypothetical protein
VPENLPKTQIMTPEEKKAIDACKDQAAQKEGFENWLKAQDEYYTERDVTSLEHTMDRAMQLYGEQCAPKWILVTERLPEPGDRFISVGVLTIAPNLPTGIVTAHYDYSYNHWTHRGDVIDVTHWMEIPKLKLTAQA